MPSEPNDDDDATVDGRDPTDEGPNPPDGRADSGDGRTPEERARAAVDAIEAFGVDRLTDFVVGAWQEGGLPPFDGEDDESNRSEDGDAVGDGERR